jgi:hypothetical protein
LCVALMAYGRLNGLSVCRVRAILVLGYVAEPEACDGMAIGARRIAKLVYRELALGPAGLADHGEAFEFSRVGVNGRDLLSSLFGRDGSRLLLLFIQFAHVR